MAGDANDRERVLDLVSTLENIARLAGAFDLGGAGVALDHAEQAGLDTASARGAVAVVLAIRGLLLAENLWPVGSADDLMVFAPKSPGESPFVVDLFEAADRLAGFQFPWRDDDARLSTRVRCAARLIGGMPGGGGPPEVR